MCASAAQPPVPLQQYEHLTVSVSDKANLTPAAVKKAIVVAASSRGWWLVADRPGVVQLATKMRGYGAVIEVSYTTEAYSIRYVSSEHLGYAQQGGAESIHPTYNRWLRNLIQSINTELLRI